MKRAVHLLDRLRFGGAESVALNYARLMSQWGVGSILSGSSDSVEFVRFASRHAVVNSGFAFKLIRSCDYLFIHSNRSLLRMFLLRPFYRKRGRHIIYMQHLPYSKSKFRLLSQLINRVCTGFIRITPLTEQLADKYIQVPVGFIPNFYHLRYTDSERPAIRKDVREELSIEPEQKMVLFTGAFRPGKGVQDFLTLAGRFESDHRFRFVMVGDGPESVRVRAYPHDNLTWVGWQADIERWLIAADVYCFLSRREMMPMALLEAQTVGVPIAAISSPVNDFLLDNRTYGDMDSIEKILPQDHLTAVKVKYDTGYARLHLEKILGIDTPKKILHIQVFPKLTGVQRVSLEIFRSLPDSEYHKTVLFGGPVNPHTGYCFEQFVAAGVQVLTCPRLLRGIGWSDWHAFRYIYRLCRREKYDIVHTHSTKPGIVGRIAARLAGVPLVIHTVHGVAFHKYESPGKRIFFYLAELFASFFSHRIILVSAFYRKYFRLFRHNMVVVHNGLPVAAQKTAADPEESRTLRLLFVGRLEPAKDPLTLLCAFSRIIHGEKRRNIRLTLVGDGELESDCRTYIAQNCLGNYITMAGWQSDPGKFYREHQIFCLSSIHEAFGLCLTEAGIYALPAVVSRVGGIPEVVEDGVTGILVPPENPEAMARGILRLADDKSLRERMGKAARKRIAERFTAERMTAGYQRIYKKEI